MKIALIDLDGTITDSAPVIMGCAREALESLGLPVPSDMRPFVGPPLAVGVTEILGVPEDRFEDFVGAYRGRYLERLHTPLFAGILPALDSLAQEGWTLGVASAKREDLVHLVLEGAGLTDRFAVIAGGGEETTSKASVIRRALEQLEEGCAVMVGDRIHDVEGAAECGIPAVFVTWGYGALAEGDAAAGVAAAPGELPTVLRQVAAASC